MVKMEVFIDYLCPFCRRSYEDLKSLIPHYPPIEIIWYPCESHPRPENVHPHTDLCIEGFYYAMDHGIDPWIYANRMFSAIQDKRENVEDLAILTQQISDLVNPEDFSEKITSQKYRPLLDRSNTHAYEESGVWAVPAYRAVGIKVDAQAGIGVSKKELEDFLSKITQNS